MERRQTKELQEKADEISKKTATLEKEYTDKRKKLDTEIANLEQKRGIEKSLSDMDKRETQCISIELECKMLELQSVK